MISYRSAPLVLIFPKTSYRNSISVLDDLPTPDELSAPDKLSAIGTYVYVRNSFYTSHSISGSPVSPSLTSVH